MKKILTIIALAICSMTMMAADLHVGDLYYDITAIEGGYAAKIVPHRSYKRLKTIEIPEYIYYQGVELPIIIGQDAFYECKKLIDIIIPKNVIGIEYDAFYGTALYNDPNRWYNGALCIDSCLIKASSYIPEEYTINDGVRLIADRAFRGCWSLKSVTIPSSVGRIGMLLFLGCGNLNIVYFNGTKEQWWRIEKDETWYNEDGSQLTIYCSDGVVVN